MNRQRLSWLDWQRGLAVVLMVEVHVLNAWIAPTEAHGFLYAVLHMAGGFAAPGFLFMAGLSQVLADRSLTRRGLLPGARLRHHLTRALWVLGVAYCFRLFEFVTGFAFMVPDGFLSIFKVDILNIIAVGLMLAAVLTVLPRRWHLLSASALTAAIVLVTPLAASLPSFPPGYLYLRAGHGFGICNWTAFLLAGGAVGRLLVHDASLGERGLGTFGLLGLGALLLAAGWGSHALPASWQGGGDFWGTAPSWFLIRLGATVLTSGLLSALANRAETGWSWLNLFGRHSLFAYMASVELTYGFWLKSLHGRLSMPLVLAGIAGMLLATLLLIRGIEFVSTRQLRARPSVPAPS